MEPQGMDNEKSRRNEVRSFTPQSFDLEGGEPALPPATVPERAFRQGIVPEARAPAAFEDGSIGTTAELDFSSIKFQRENTLLTNAESYAASIREEAQLYVQQLRGEVEALNAEAEKRYEEAARVKEEAEENVRQMVEEAEAKVEEIKETARREGYDEGLEEGMARRYEEAGPQVERLEAICREIGQFRKRVAYYTEKDGVRLAMMIAKKILNAELKTNRRAILRLVASTLSKLEGKGVFRIWLNEEDHAFVLKARPSLERFLEEGQSLILRARADLNPGDVLIETDREVIDLTLESQFYHLEQRIQQTLAEREATVTQQERPSAVRSAPAAAPPREAPASAETEDAAAEGEGAASDEA